MAYTKSADVLIMHNNKALAGQTEVSFEASSEFEEFVDRAKAMQGEVMTSRELTGQDFSLDLTQMVNLSDLTATGVFKILWDAWKSGSDMTLKIATKGASYDPVASTGTTDVIEAVMKIESLSGEASDGLFNVEVSFVANGSVELVPTV